MPETSTRPVCDPTVGAAIVPPAETAVVTTPSAARAVRTTVPPGARMVPVLVTSAVTGCPPTCTCVTWP